VCHVWKGSVFPSLWCEATTLRPSALTASMVLVLATIWFFVEPSETSVGSIFAPGFYRLPPVLLVPRLLRRLLLLSLPFFLRLSSPCLRQPNSKFTLVEKLRVLWS
jgi:hypothetical protein